VAVFVFALNMHPAGDVVTITIDRRTVIEYISRAPSPAEPVERQRGARARRLGDAEPVEQRRSRSETHSLTSLAPPDAYSCRAPRRAGRARLERLSGGTVSDVLEPLSRVGAAQRDPSRRSRVGKPRRGLERGARGPVELPTDTAPLNASASRRAHTSSLRPTSAQPSAARGHNLESTD
jgi:hypothetical protein